MTRLLVHAEGWTERDFVDEVLQEHLVDHGFSSVASRLVGNRRRQNQRGGITGWHSARAGIVKRLRQDKGSIATTMVDYYGLPQSGEGAWPGRREASRVPVAERGRSVEKALSVDVRREMGDAFDRRRFVPYVMMHEFEALLFSDCDTFASVIGRPERAPELKNVRDSFVSPEEIDDSRETAPSSRIAGLVPDYRKRVDGIQAVGAIGLERIREECPHFDDWLRRLERLPASM